VKEVHLLLALSLKKGIGPKTILKGIESGDLENWIRENRIDLEEELKLAEEEIKLSEKFGVSLIPITSPEYPPLLKEIPDPPPVLYVKGNIPKIPSIAVVGSRKCSEYGRRIAFKLGKFLAENDICVVSGLAYGIDSKAHEGTVSCGGKGVAVLGCGLKNVYPPSNRKLAQKIVELGGALVSEFPLQTPPLKENFPRRNRIISGLSYGIVVVEAREKSGTKITVRHALEQGRVVFAVPGNIESPFSKGTNQLISEGAIPLYEFETIFEELKFLKRKEKRKKEVQSPVVEALKESPKTFDQLLEKTGLSYQKLSFELSVLEMKGVVKREGMFYVMVD